MNKIGISFMLVLSLLISIVIAYSAEDNKIYYDEKTGLEWLPGPDCDTSWKMAKSWVESLSSSTGGGWRMPTRMELKTLYKEREGIRNITPDLETTGLRVWSCETDNKPSAWLFDYSYGGEYCLPIDLTTHFVRGFAVRP